MENIEFAWDEGNINNVILKDPIRNNTTDEVESVLFYPEIEEVEQEHPDDLVRYICIGCSNKGRWYEIGHVKREGKVRIFHAIPFGSGEKGRKKAYKSFYAKVSRG